MKLRFTFKTYNIYGLEQRARTVGEFFVSPPHFHAWFHGKIGCLWLNYAFTRAAGRRTNAASFPFLGDRQVCRYAASSAQLALDAPFWYIYRKTFIFLFSLLCSNHLMRSMVL